MSEVIGLSISVVTLDVKEYLRGCLTSIFHHSPSFPFEVIVVDNGSSDGTAEMLEKEFPEIRLIRNNTNVGFAKAHNQALAQSRGRYFMILNPDTELKPDTLRTMLSFMENHPEAGMVGPKMLNPDGSLQPSCHQRFPNLLDLVLDTFGIGPCVLWLQKRRLFRKFFLKRFYADYGRETEIAWAGGACLMARRKAIDQAGGLDETYFIYREDTDWCFEFRRHGWKVFYLPQAEIIHHWGKTPGRWEGVRTVSATRSNLHFFSRHTSKVFRWVVPPLCLLAVLLRLVWTGAEYLFLRSRGDLLGRKLKAYGMAFTSILKLRRS